MLLNCIELPILPIHFTLYVNKAALLYNKVKPD